mgnify:CR=1 FL=1
MQKMITKRVDVTATFTGNMSGSDKGNCQYERHARGYLNGHCGHYHCAIHTIVGGGHRRCDKCIADFGAGEE